MKKYILTVIAILVTMQAASAINWNRALSPLITGTYKTQATQPKTTVSSADVITELAKFQNQAQSIDNSVQNSFLSIVSQLSTKQEASTIQSKVMSILANSSKTQQQKSDMIDELIANYTQNLASNKSDVVTIIKNMSTSDKTTLANNLAALVQNSQQYAALAKQGTTTAATLMKASQDAKDIISTVNTIRQTAVTVKNRATTVANFVNKVRTISKYAGLFI